MPQITEFGRAIKKRLIDLDKNQNWLIDQVREQTGLFFDSSYMSKILTGQLATPKITAAIRDILGLPDSEHQSNPVKESP